MKENKKGLTLEKLKKDVPSGFFLWPILIVFGILFEGMSIFVLCYHKNDLSELGFLIITPIAFAIGALFLIIYCIKKIKEVKNKKTLITSGNFTIVEDKIYDKYMEYLGEDNYGYFIFSKIYGQISTDESVYDDPIYKDVKKGDSIYLVFSDNQEINNICDAKESKRNSDNIVLKYLAKKYELSFELKDKFIPYNKTLGESNYNNRIKMQIKELEENKGAVNCKKCGKKYKLSKYDVCPECNSKYKFDIIDVMHEKEWY